MTSRTSGGRVGRRLDAPVLFAELALVADRDAVAREVVAWVNARYAPCSFGLFTSVDGARGFLAERDKVGALGRLRAAGDLILDPVPAAVGGVLAGSA